MLTDDLRKVLGAKAADLFMQQYGGQRVWIPLPRYRPGRRRQELTKLLGAPTANKLFERWGGDVMEVPNGKHHYGLESQRLAMKMQRNGTTISEMATAVGCSRRTIFRWLNQPANELR